MGDTWVTCVFARSVAMWVAAILRRTNTPASISRATKHPIVKSIEPGEDWFWCYVDEVMFEEASRKPNQGLIRSPSYPDQRPML